MPPTRSSRIRSQGSRPASGAPSRSRPARRRPRSTMSIPAAMPTVAVRPPSGRPVTARRPRARSPARYPSPSTRSGRWSPAPSAIPNRASQRRRILRRIDLAEGIVEFEINAPLIARSARAGQFVRVLGWDKGELIPLTLADWDAEQRHHRPGQCRAWAAVRRTSTGCRKAKRSPVSPDRSACPASCIATRTARPWCSPPAVSACRRCTRSCASTCAWVTMSP